MKVVLFCGGLGTRLREHSETIPKPLVAIGYRPILWYLMKYYAYYGHTDFIVCLGYRGDQIKEFFVNYDPSYSADFVLHQGQRSFATEGSDVPDWSIRFVETGLHSNIGMRLLAVRRYLHDERMFLANYSDQLSDLPLPDYLEQFERRNAIAGFVSVQPPQSYHVADIDADGAVRGIHLMSDGDHWVNGGYLAFKQEFFDYMRQGEELVEAPFDRLINAGRLYAYKYRGFWRPMDTFKDKIAFDHMWAHGETPWEVWRSRPNDEPHPDVDVTTPDALVEPFSASASYSSRQRRSKRAGDGSDGAKRH